MKSTTLAAAVLGLAVTLAAPAHADPDTDFARELHTYGIYGPRDYNAWLGKIVCERLDKGVDGDAAKSVRFITPTCKREPTRRRPGSSLAPRSTPTARTSGRCWSAQHSKAD